jgi:NUDIX domain-containing protein
LKFLSFRLLKPEAQPYDLFLIDHTHSCWYAEKRISHFPQRYAEYQVKLGKRKLSIDTAAFAMPIKLQKYWSDIVGPILRRENPPTVPQAVILYDQQVLLVKRDNPSLWELPGGEILPGETPEEAIHREVYEETGINVEIIELLGWYKRTGFVRTVHRCTCAVRLEAAYDRNPTM